MSTTKAFGIVSPKFPLGQIVIKPRALEALAAANENPLYLLQRHAQGDWGDLGEKEKRKNDLCLKKGLRISSVYKLKDGTSIWIMTDPTLGGTKLFVYAEV